MITLILLVFLSSLLSGWLLKSTFDKHSSRVESKKIIKEATTQFQEVLNNLKTDKCSLRGRINSSVYIDMKLIDHGDVSVIYLIDKKIISIFKGENCLHVSTIIDRSLSIDIEYRITVKYESKIKDIVNVLGFIFSKEYFEKTFNLKIEDLKNGKIQILEPKEKSEVEKITSKNEIKLNIDDILDKINKVGIENLTQEENKFLSNYK